MFRRLPSAISYLLSPIAPLFAGICIWRYPHLSLLARARNVALAHLSAAVIILDTHYRLLDLNAAAERFIGRSASEAIGLPFNQVCSRPTLLQAITATAEQSEVVVESALGQSQLKLETSPVYDRRGRLAARTIIIRDATPQRRAHDESKIRALQFQATTSQLAAANERLRLLSRVKDEFVSNVSHELRTPITNIKLYLDLISHRPDKHTAYVATLRRETERLESLIEDLLTLSRLDQNRLTFESTTFDLNELVSQYVADRDALAQQKELSLTFHPSPSLPSLEADPDLIGQVLSILMTNAFNYTSPGGSVSVQTHYNGEEVGFSVGDTGPGIHPEEHEALFKRFYRGTAGNAAKVSGTGLGLAIAKEIVQRHHGRIEVKSEGISGRGAHFFVWLPLGAAR